MAICVLSMLWPYLKCKALTWWRGMAGTYTLDTLSWSDLCALLEAEFQDIDREMKLLRRIQGLLSC